jgi:hypothetical protein
MLRRTHGEQLDGVRGVHEVGILVPLDVNGYDLVAQPVERLIGSLPANAGPPSGILAGHGAERPRMRTHEFDVARISSHRIELHVGECLLERRIGPLPAIPPIRWTVT